MTNKRTILLAFVTSAGLIGAGSVWAQAGETGAESSSMHHQMMQDGRGMMTMMSQMESMMEKCDSMMDRMHQDDHSSMNADQTDD